MLLAGDGVEGLLLSGLEEKDSSRTRGDGLVPLSPASLGRVKYPRRVYGCRRRFWREIDEVVVRGNDGNVSFAGALFRFSRLTKFWVTSTLETRVIK